MDTSSYVVYVRVPCKARRLFGSIVWVTRSAARATSSRREKADYGYCSTIEWALAVAVRAGWLVRVCSRSDG